jgi:A/G-specific adenine glycosylase
MENKLFYKSLLDWYQIHKRSLPFRDVEDPYKIWLSEIMLQQTKVSTVIPYYRKWIFKYPNISSVANSDLEDLLKMWEGLGYYNRCRNFHKASKVICDQHKGYIPDDWTSFISLPGVGEYTASAVLSIAFGKKYAVLDGNVKRVMFRQLGFKKSSTQNMKRVKNRLKKLIPDFKPGDFNQSMMELGATICFPRNPKCGNCPISSSCIGFKNRKPEAYPTKNKKSVIPEYHFISGFLWDGENFLIRKRETNLMLGGLWEIPNFKINVDEEPILTFVKKVKKDLHLDIKMKEKLGEVKHRYSHFSVLVSVYSCKIINKESLNKEKQKLIIPREIASFPFSNVNHKIFSLMGYNN